MDSAFLASLLQHPSRRALLVLDPQGKVMAGNDRARELVTEVLEQELRPALAQGMAQLATHPDHQVHYLHEGEGLQLDCVLRAVRSGAGQTLGYTVSLFGLNEAPELAESPDRARWRFALENAQDGLWDWSADTGRVYRSSRCLSMLGYPREFLDDELHSWRALVHPDDQARVTEALDQHLGGIRPNYQSEYRVRDAMGAWRWILDRGRVISWNLDGTPRRVVGTHTDITGYKQIEEQLRERELLMNQAQHVARIGSWSWDPEADRVWWSDELYLIAGLAPGSKPPPFRRQRALFEESSYERLRAASRKILQDGTPYNLELVMLRPDGERRHVLARGEGLRGDDGRVIRLVGVLHDVTEQVRAEETSRWRNDLLNRIAALGRIGGFELLADGQLHWTDENFRIHGFEPGTPISLESTLPHYESESRKRVAEAARRMFEQGSLEETVEATFITPDERRIWLRITGRLEYRDGQPYRITGLTQDMTEEHEASEQIEQLAHYDTLTGLPNRFLFRRRAEDAIAAVRNGEPPLALLFLDLDRFKNVNDTLGHEAGDRLLQEVAGRLATCVRGSDLVGRLGGDEFLILLREVARPEDAAVVARKIIAALGEPVLLNDTEAKVGCSIGIALLGEGSPDLEALLRAADTAMYAAKDAGRNTYQFYSDSFFEKVQRRVTLEQELRLALPRGELSLVYQPTLSLADGRVAGIEALLRWRTAAGDQRSPVEFIPIAEDSGEILAIGRWVLGEACRQACAWHAAGLEFGRIAVNVSAVQLRDPQFADDVIDLCNQSGWPTDRLELELTESALMRDTDVLRRAFDIFASNGITLAVDDFGTGFSNLAYLHRFPVRHLKIDRSFVQQMVAGDRMRGLTQAVVSLGHALGMEVVAEGVETEQALAMLREQGCDQAQGYLFTRPLSPADLETWLRAQAEPD
ncbi:sensor domain-containing protein [Arenimonas sp. MALMAid1274]|uniref:sensor domain-containing protein n=1 Tax=Arenimonas sp. MALMAid1274 TaxID=3411630 RepID=UPI003BA35050